MKTIKIEKLEELNGYEWYHNGRGFYLDESISSKSKLVLIEKNYIDSDGEMEDRRSAFFSLKNLTELEFYGLKVVLNEKPKLTRQEQEFLKSIDMDEMHIARDEDGDIYCFFQPPKIIKDYWSRNDPNGIYCFKIFDNLFSFITWESGKAWSKSELMELEVVE